MVENNLTNKHWILNVPFNTTIYIALAIIYSIAPAVLYLYFYNYPVFKELDFLKTLLVSGSGGILIYSFNYIYCYTMVYLVLLPNEKYDKKLINHHPALLVNMVYSFTLLITLITYVWDKRVISPVQLFSIAEYLIIIGIPLFFVVVHFTSKRN